MKFLAGILFVSLLAVGCGKKEKEKEVNTSITLEDLKKPANVTSISKDDLPSQIRDLSVFVANSDDTSDDKSSCFADAATITQSGNTLTVLVNKDLASCQNKESAGSDDSVKLQYDLFSVYFKAVAKCDDYADQDLSKNSMAEIAAVVCNADQERLSTSKLKLKYGYSYESGGKTIKNTRNGETLQFTGNENLKPCTVQYESGVHALNCIDYNISSETSSVETDGKEVKSENVDYIKTQSINVKTKADYSNKYYLSGKTEVILNDWTGVVTHNGADVAPTYTFTNGTDTISGTYTDSSDETE